MLNIAGLLYIIHNVVLTPTGTTLVKGTDT